MYSKRAEALAAWTNGLELAALTADVDRACLILETGVNQRWRYGGYRRSPETTGEAKEWENAKKNNRWGRLPQADCCNCYSVLPICWQS